MVSAYSRKKATYNVSLKRLTYWVTESAQATLYDITETQAKAIIRDVAIGHREIVQILDIVPNH